MTGQIVINFSITEKRTAFSGEKINIIKLLSEQGVSGEALCYVKKENGYPSDANDGVVYFFFFALKPGQIVERRVKTKKNEYLRIFVRDAGKAGMYRLQGEL
jgi:hypothetical protein